MECVIRYFWLNGYSSKERENVFSILISFTRMLLQLFGHLTYFEMTTAPQESNQIDSFISSMGNAFVTGHLLGSIFPVGHSLICVPYGSKIKTLSSQLPRSVYSSSIQMALWTGANALVSPLINEYIQESLPRSIISSAATGALLNCRLGYDGMLSGAVLSSLQAIQLQAVSYLFSLPFTPLHNRYIQKKKRELYHKRTTTSLVTPINAIFSAFNL